MCAIDVSRHNNKYSLKDYFLIRIDMRSYKRIEKLLPDIYQGFADDRLD